MAEWQGQDLRAYRDRLLQAGVPYKKVKRHLLELRDHYRELLREAARRGLDAIGAKAWAEEQLGSLREIGYQMLANTSKRSVWHRYPRLMALLLPATLYFFSLCAVIAAMAVSLELTGRFFSEGIDLHVAHPLWMDVVYPSALTFLLYGLTPLVSLLLIRQQVRQMVPLGLIVVGTLALCLLGSSAHVRLTWPDPATLEEGRLEASLAYGWIAANTLRLVANVALSALGWVWWQRQRELLPQ